MLAKKSLRHQLRAFLVGILELFNDGYIPFTILSLRMEQLFIYKYILRYKSSAIY